MLVCARIIHDTSKQPVVNEGNKGHGKHMGEFGCRPCRTSSLARSLQLLLTCSLQLLLTYFLVPATMISWKNISVRCQIHLNMDIKPYKLW
jgi:hypothetical protein